MALADEPPAHVDPATESAVLYSLRRATAGRTTIIVVHRPALAAIADRLIHLDSGRRAEAPLSVVSPQLVPGEQADSGVASDQPCTPVSPQPQPRPPHQ